MLPPGGTNLTALSRRTAIIRRRCFVWLERAFEDGWQVRETSSGELVSILYGPCAGVGRVALDPSPEIVGINAVSLISVTRERFLSWILDSPCSISLGAHHHTRR